MKLYMKQKVFSWGDKFTIKDEYGADKYYVEGQVFSLGKKLRVYDLVGAEVAYIEQQIFTFMPKFFVYINGVKVAEIVKEFSFLRPRYSIAGLGWEIEGSFMAHDYWISQNGNEIVRISKEWMTWGDSYLIDIADKDDEIVALAVVLAIDCVLAAASAAASASSS